MHRSNGILLALVLSVRISAYAQTPVVQAVLNAASYTTNLAPDTVIAIFGTQLAPSTVVATDVPSVQLGGVSIVAGDKSLRLQFVSPNQINAILAVDSPSGYLPLVVTTPAGSSAPVQIFLTTSALGIFTRDATGSGPVLPVAGEYHGIRDPDPFTFYITGIGPASPNVPLFSPPLELVDPQVFIGGLPATVDFFGFGSSEPGIIVFGATPTDGPLPDNTVYVSALSATSPLSLTHSNVASLPLPGFGKNVTNVTGSINGLYPSSSGKSTSTPLSFSPLLTAATYNAAFDIVPNAQPFNVIASSPGGKAQIHIDPAANTWTATITVPTAAARVYDFSGVPNFPVVDFLNAGEPFPNSVLPVSRLDPVAIAAIASLLLPKYTGSGAPSPTVTYTSSGALPANRHFEISSATLSDLSRFGGFTQAYSLAQSGVLNQSVNFTLVVDGLLIASRAVSYQVN